MTWSKSTNSRSGISPFIACKRASSKASSRCCAGAVPDGSVDSFRNCCPWPKTRGLSISLGRETVETVCRQLRSWTEALPQSDLTLTLNVSERQFYHPEMVPQLKKALAANAAWIRTRLLFEVAESTLNEKPGRGGRHPAAHGGTAKCASR